MSIYDLYETNTDLETSGIFYEDGNIRVKLARAGGGNTRFSKVLEAETKPYRRQLDNKLLPERKVRELFCKIYAKAVILGWETDVNSTKRKAYKGDKDPYEVHPEKYMPGIESRDGTLLPYNEENVVATLMALPILFDKIRAVADDYTAFRASLEEEEAKN